MGHCDAEGTTDLAIAGVLVFGTWLSYFPQQVEIVWKKTSEGLSGFFIFMMTIANFCNTLATIILQYDLFQCCDSLNFWKCNELLLPEVWVVGMNFINVYPIYILFLIFFDSKQFENPNEKRNAFILFIVFNIIMFIFIGISILLLEIGGSNHQGFSSFGKIVGVISSITNVLMWLPQLFYTWKLKKVGSLSIPMLALQAPGALIVGIFETTSGANWAVALPFFAAFVIISILLSLCIYYEIKNRCFSEKVGQKSDHDDTKKLLEDDTIN